MILIKMNYCITCIPCALQSLSINILLLPLLQALLVFLLVTDGDIVLLTITPCLILPAVPALLPLPEEPPLPPLLFQILKWC